MTEHPTQLEIPKGSYYYDCPAQTVAIRMKTNFENKHDISRVGRTREFAPKKPQLQLHEPNIVDHLSSLNAVSYSLPPFAHDYRSLPFAFLFLTRPIRRSYTPCSSHPYIRLMGVRRARSLGTMIMSVTSLKNQPVFFFFLGRSSSSSSSSPSSSSISSFSLLAPWSTPLSLSEPELS